MKETMACPVCGKENKYEYYEEYGFGIVERHYYCDRCTYFVEQVYSQPFTGVSTDCPEEYRAKAQELGLSFLEPEEIP